MALDNLLIAVGEDGGIFGAPQSNIGIRIDGLSASGDITGCDFSPDGGMLALTHRSGRYLTVFNTSDWSVIPTPSLARQGEGCAFSPDGSLLAVAHQSGSYLTVFNTSDWSVAPAPSLSGHSYDCAFSPDGRFLAVVYRSGSYIAVIDTTDWSVVSGPTLAGQGNSCAFSPDGSLLVATHFSGSNVSYFNTSDWSAASGPSIDGFGYSCAFSPDGTLLAIGSSSAKELAVFNTSDWSAVFSESYVSECRGCAFSQDGAYLAAAYGGGSGFSVYETVGWTEVSAPNLPADGLDCVFSAVPVNIPSRDIKTINQAGTLVESAVTISDRQLNLVKTIQSTGEASFMHLKIDDFWLIMKDNRVGATSDAFARISLSSTSAELPPVLLVQGYAGDLVTISSNLTTQAGAPGDEVVIRNWTTRELVAKVIPDANGDWSAEVPPGTYDVSYIAENCAPVIHGPYTITLP